MSDPAVKSGIPEGALMMPPMCDKHQYLLCQQAGYKESDPWRALIIVSQLALFQAMTADPKIYERVHGKVECIAELGCHACCKPDAFGEIVEAAKTHDLGAIKKLGEKWVQESGTMGSGHE